MEGKNTKSEEPNDKPPGYYENDGFTTAVDNTLAYKDPEQPGYQQPQAYKPQLGYLLKSGFPTKLGYQSQPSCVLRETQPQEQYCKQHIRKRQQRQYIVNGMVIAFIVTFFCFPPTGIVAFFYASKAYSMAEIGNAEGANKAEAAARLLIKVSIIVGLLLMSFVVAMPVIMKLILL